MLACHPGFLQACLGPGHGGRKSPGLCGARRQLGSGVVPSQYRSLPGPVSALWGLIPWPCVLGAAVHQRGIRRAGPASYPHLSASCSSTKFAFGKPPHSPHLIYKIKDDPISSSRAGNVTLAWSISAVNLELCLDWGRSQDSGWVNHGQSSARMVGEQQLSFHRVVKP